MRPATRTDLPAIIDLLDRAFAPSRYESKLVADLINRGKVIHHWVADRDGQIAAYIAYTHAYRGDEFVGYHLAPVAVVPELQNQGLGSALIADSLATPPIQGMPVFVLGHPAYYPRFGFTAITNPICPFTDGNENFMALNSPFEFDEAFAIGYEAEFLGA